MSLENQTPPLIPWRHFANWIGMDREHQTVKKWIDEGLLPSHAVGGITMVNMVALKKVLLNPKD
jgi:hypothetical protein